MTGNRKDHIRVWKHKEKEDKSDSTEIRWAGTYYLRLGFFALFEWSSRASSTLRMIKH